MIDLLFGKGADIEIQINLGNTALQETCRHGHFSDVGCLLRLDAMEATHTFQESLYRTKRENCRQGCRSYELIRYGPRTRCPKSRKTVGLIR